MREAPLASIPVARSRVSWRPKLDLPSEPSRSLSVLNPRKSSDLSVTSNLTLVSFPFPTPGAEAGRSLGSWMVGAVSDLLAPSFHENSLRIALLALCPGYLWAAWHLARAGRWIKADVECARDAQAA